MAMSIGGSGGVRNEINITPLVDVVMVLLIIFMIALPLTIVTPVSLPPQPGATPQVPPNAIVLRLDPEGRIFVNQEQISAAAFPATLRGLLANRKSGLVFLAADGDLDYQRVADFLALCRTNGADEIGIVLNELR